MSEHQQEHLWAPTPERRTRGRVWLIVGLIVAALLIVGAVLWLFLRPDAPDAGPAATSSPSASASPSESATPSASPSSDGQPSSPPVQTAPPAPKDPSIATFRDKVSPVLDDGHRGLQIAAESDPQQAAQNVGFLQDDAARLSDAVPPSSIAAQWRRALQDYATALDDLRTAYEASGPGDAELAAATKALDALDALLAG